MPGSTTGGFPYALPADPLVQWPATSQSLAEKIDQKIAALPRIATGVATTTGESAVLVNFPPGRFTAPPKVVVTPVGSVETAIVPQIWTDPNAAQFALITYRASDGVKVAWPCHWIAVQE
jgi:hypothetical protein